MKMKDQKNRIVLIGDSIFDNGSYVGEGESVTEILSGLFKGHIYGN